MNLTYNKKSFNLNEDNGECYILTDFNRAADGTITFKEKINYENPLLGWNFFMQNMEFQGRKKIQEILIKQNKNPMTGELNG